MKQFVKYMLASTAGTVIAFIMMFFVMGLIVAGMISSAVMMASNVEKKVKVEENSVLVINMAERIVERKEPNPFEDLEIDGFDSEKSIELDDLLDAIEAAKTDDRIKGIHLKGAMFSGRFATLEAVRDAIIDFKESGKFVVAYNEVYSHGAYYLASAADEVYLFKEGLLELHGLSSQTPFFKNMLDKIGVETIVLRGPDNKYKSAVEPFFREDMSEASKEQTQRIIDVLWGHMVDGISETRGVTAEEINRIANNMELKESEDAVDLGLVDGAIYYDELLANLRGKLELEEGDDIESIKVSKYAKVDHKAGGEDDEDSEKEKSWELQDEIAVIYAVGGIESGEGDEETIGSETVSKAIREAREDEDVKAIVMRVNSPGGSALASDVIWREVTLAKEVKPFIVSFGDVAASGGYYISTHADRIFASPSTITGSIGVFGLIPDARELITDKMGITFDGVKTNDHADLGSMKRGFSEEEMMWFDHLITDTYEEFVARVAEGRGMTVEDVDSIARGRVWIGEDALSIGLIDEYGGLDEAIAYAAEQAGLEKYDLRELPEKEDPLKSFLKDLSGDARMTVAEWVLGDGEELELLQQVQEVKEMKGVQARMMFDLAVD